MICKTLSTAAIGVGLLTLASIVPALASEHFVPKGVQGETQMGLLIKTPDTPHGVSFNQQIASAQTATAPI